MKIVLDGWGINAENFSKTAEEFDIDIEDQIGSFRWRVTSERIPEFEAAAGKCDTLDAAKAMAERVAGLLKALL